MLSSQSMPLADKRQTKLSPVCTNCRERHLKCNGGPVCTRCRNEGVACLFKPSRRGMRPSNRRKSTSDRRNSSVSQLSVEWLPIQQSLATQLPSPIMSPAPNGQLRPRASSIVKIEAPPTSPQSAHLIDLFYQLFFPTHPFVLPREHLAEKLATSDLHYLQVVIEYIGSYYDETSNRSRYRYLSELLLFTQHYNEDIFAVQAFILLAIGLHADGETMKADDALRQARDIAVSSGMSDLACSVPRSGGLSTEEESWRRTWWTLKSLIHAWPPSRPLSAISSPLSGRFPHESYLSSSSTLSSPNLVILGPTAERKFSPAFQYLTGEEFWNPPERSDSGSSDRSHSIIPGFEPANLYNGPALRYHDSWTASGSVSLLGQPSEPTFIDRICISHNA